MNMDLAIAISCDGAACIVRKLGTETPIDATLSDLMVEHWIRVRPGDLLAADLESDPPQVMYRWWQATVIAVEDGKVAIRPLPSKADLTESGTASVLGGIDPKPKVGDVVFATNSEGGEPIVMDVGMDREPAHPDRFIEQYPHILELNSRR